MVFGFFQGITGSPIVSTLFRLIVAMGVTAVVTLLFPVIVLLGALLLKLKRGRKSPQPSPRHPISTSSSS